MLGLERVKAASRNRAVNAEHLSVVGSVASKAKRKTVRYQTATMIQLKLYVKNDLFPKWKFIAMRSKLDSSTDAFSIAHQCLVH